MWQLSEVQQIFLFLNHKQKQLPNMNSRGVQDSLIKKLTNFFYLICLQKLHCTFLAKHYTLIKASKQNNESLVSTQNKIKLHLCSLLQSLELKLTNYINTCDQTNSTVQLSVG